MLHVCKCFLCSLSKAKSFPYLEQFDIIFLTCRLYLPYRKDKNNVSTNEWSAERAYIYLIKKIKITCSFMS